MNSVTIRETYPTNAFIDTFIKSHNLILLISGVEKKKC